MFVAAVEAAKAEAGAVQARIASVTIAVAGPENPRVTLDDQRVPVAALGVKRPVDPGDHVVKATADGWQPAGDEIHGRRRGWARTRRSR